MRTAILCAIGVLWAGGAQAETKLAPGTEIGPVIAGQCAKTTAISALKGRTPNAPGAFACDRAAISFFGDGAGVMILFLPPGPKAGGVTFSGLIGPDDIVKIQRVYFADRALPASDGACSQKAEGVTLKEIDCEAVVGGQRQAVKFVVDPMPESASPAVPSAPTSR